MEYSPLSFVIAFFRIFFFDIISSFLFKFSFRVHQKKNTENFPSFLCERQRQVLYLSVDTLVGWQVHGKSQRHEGVIVTNSPTDWSDWLPAWLPVCHTNDDVGDDAADVDAGWCCCCSCKLPGSLLDGGKNQEMLLLMMLRLALNGLTHPPRLYTNTHSHTHTNGHNQLHAHESTANHNLPQSEENQQNTAGKIRVLLNGSGKCCCLLLFSSSIFSHKLLVIFHVY